MDPTHPSSAPDWRKQVWLQPEFSGRMPKASLIPDTISSGTWPGCISWCWSLWGNNTPAVVTPRWQARLLLAGWNWLPIAFRIKPQVLPVAQKFWPLLYLQFHLLILSLSCAPAILAFLLPPPASSQYLWTCWTFYLEHSPSRLPFKSEIKCHLSHRLSVTSLSKIYLHP